MKLFHMYRNHRKSAPPLLILQEDSKQQSIGEFIALKSHTCNFLLTFACLILNYSTKFIYNKYCLMEL